MSTLTVFRLRAQWIVIQILETLLWLSFIIMSSAPEVNAALVVFEKSMNMRVCSGNLESGTHSLGNPGSRRVNKGEILLILVSWQGSLESKESNGTGFIVSPNRLQFHLLESSDFSALWFFFFFLNPEFEPKRQYWWWTEGNSLERKSWQFSLWLIPFPCPCSLARGIYFHSWMFLGSLSDYHPSLPRYFMNCHSQILFLPSNMPAWSPAGFQGLSRHLAMWAALQSLLVCMVWADILQNWYFTINEDQTLSQTQVFISELLYHCSFMLDLLNYLK